MEFGVPSLPFTSLFPLRNRQHRPSLSGRTWTLETPEFAPNSEVVEVKAAGSSPSSPSSLPVMCLVNVSRVSEWI